MLHFLLLPLLANVAAPAAEKKPVPFARVMAFQGAASLEPAHTNLALGQELAEGSRVTVMENSWVRLKLADGIVLHLGPHSEVELSRTRDRISVARLIHGMLLSVLKPAESTVTKDRFRVRTHKVSLGVRGTEFFVRQDLNQPAFVCVCSGKVHAKWEAGEHHMASTKPHEHYLHIHHTRKKPQKAADMGSDHDDKLLAALRELL